MKLTPSRFFKAPIISAAGSTDDAVATWTGEGASDGAGSTLASGGDLTGDGLPDLVVGAGGWSTDTGAVYVLGSGALSGGSLSGADARFYPLDRDDAGQFFGSSVAMLGDLDGDGIGDLGVGWGYHDSSNGAVVVYLGPLSGAKDATDWDGFVAGSGGAFGVHNESLAGPGDVDGDGTPDILVGAPETHIDSTSEGTNAGSAWLISGASALAETDVRLATATFPGPPPRTSSPCRACRRRAHPHTPRRWSPRRRSPPSAAVYSSVSVSVSAAPALSASAAAFARRSAAYSSGR